MEPYKKLASQLRMGAGELEFGPQSHEAGDDEDDGYNCPLGYVHFLDQPVEIVKGASDPFGNEISHRRCIREW